MQCHARDDSLIYFQDGTGGVGGGVTLHIYHMRKIVCGFIFSGEEPQGLKGQIPPESLLQAVTPEVGP